MDIFSLCIGVFSTLQSRVRLTNDTTTPGASQVATLHGRRFMTYTQEEAYPHYTNAKSSVPIDLISIHLPGDGKRQKAHTLVVADRPLENGEQVSGDIRAVLATLLNHQLISDADAQACLAYHGITR